MDRVTREARANAFLESDEAYECKYCDESVSAATPLFLLEFGYVLQGAHTLQHVSLQTSQGDYVHEPYFFHEECWEKVLEQIHSTQEDTPVLKVDAREHLGDCRCCSSPLVRRDTVGVHTLGGLYLSDREPQGLLTVDFHPEDVPQYLCMDCMRYLNNAVIEGLWWLPAS